MDPVSQAFLGAAAAQSLPSKIQHPARWSVLAIGALGGLAPDLDVLISSSSDSLLHIEYHRHFTHSLFFVPVIALLVSIFSYPLFKSKMKFGKIYSYAFMGALTHGLLDACTSYGTHLFWPFTQGRESWSIISIIDPLFTLPLLLMCLVSAYRSSVRTAQIGLLWCFFYLGIGVFQHMRAEAFYESYLTKNFPTNQLQSVLVKPTIANLWVWRGVAVYEDHYRVDGLRLSFIGDDKVYEGRRVQKFEASGPWKHYQRKGRPWSDLKRFEFFSEGLIYQLPNRASLVGDLRYSLLPHSIQPLWVVELEAGQPLERGLKFYHTRDVTREKREVFKKMLLGRPISQEDLGND